VLFVLKFFEYNWQIRDEWLEWCSELTKEDLLKERIGGVGSILHTLFHIIDVECSWVRGIQGIDDEEAQFEDYRTLEKVKELSAAYRNEMIDFLKTNLEERKDEVVTVPWDDDHHTIDGILHHIIIHEIHHIGQLSVWARELNLMPVSANFVRKEYKSVYAY
jgi:uncharacterized damage-inducible protein DinB